MLHMLHVDEAEVRCERCLCIARMHHRTHARTQVHAAALTHAPNPNPSPAAQSPLPSALPCPQAILQAQARHAGQQALFAHLALYHATYCRIFRPALQDRWVHGLLHTLFHSLLPRDPLVTRDDARLRLVVVTRLLATGLTAEACGAAAIGHTQGAGQAAAAAEAGAAAAIGGVQEAGRAAAAAGGHLGSQQCLPPDLLVAAYQCLTHAMVQMETCIREQATCALAGEAHSPACPPNAQQADIEAHVRCGGSQKPHAVGRGLTA